MMGRKLDFVNGGNGFKNPFYKLQAKAETFASAEVSDEAQSTLCSTEGE